MGHKRKFVSRTGRKPAGGFKFISMTDLATVWWLYRERRIRLYDLRVWFAAQEMLARREAHKGPRKPHYGVDEVIGLVGGGGGRTAAQAALRRLERESLLRLRPDRIENPGRSLEGGARKLLDQLPNRNRRVPVPRRLVRLIAGGLKASSIATALGTVIRCLYWSRAEQCCRATGAVKVSWLVETFGVSERAVRDARHHLEHELGFLQTEDVPQWYLNRFGSRVSVNLEFNLAPDNSIENAQLETESAPLNRKFDTQSAPPYENKEPLTRSNNQNPIRAGFSISKKDQEPRLSNVVIEDLRSTKRLLKLFEEARGRGLVTGSESSELRFLAAAEHARVIGSRNPPGLFSWLVRHRKWSYITEGDEERALLGLKEHRYGMQEREEIVCGGGRVPLSKDAKIVNQITRRLRSMGIEGSLWTHVAKSCPEWTEERWEAAKLETLTSQTQRQRAFA